MAKMLTKPPILYAVSDESINGSKQFCLYFCLIQDSLFLIVPGLNLFILLGLFFIPGTKKENNLPE